MKEEKKNLSDEVMLLKSSEEKLAKERDAMKEEKKKLEYMLFDLIKARDGDKAVKEANLDKVMRIKKIWEE